MQPERGAFENSGWTTHLLASMSRLFALAARWGGRERQVLRGWIPWQAISWTAWLRGCAISQNRPDSHQESPQILEQHLATGVDDSAGGNY